MQSFKPCLWMASEKKNTTCTFRAWTLVSTYWRNPTSTLSFEHTPNSKHIIWFLLEKLFCAPKKSLKHPLKHVPSPICQQVLLLMVNPPTISIRSPVFFFSTEIPNKRRVPDQNENPTVQRSLGFLTTPATAKHAKSGGLAAMAVAATRRSEAAKAVSCCP